jgi:hypothetical protein
LEWVIAAAWPDICFGYGGQLVLYHYLGDDSPTVENCLLVRTSVLAHPEQSLVDMATRLGLYLHHVRDEDLRAAGGDRHLAALVTYRRTTCLPRVESRAPNHATALVETSRAALQHAGR